MTLELLKEIFYGIIVHVLLYTTSGFISNVFEIHKTNVITAIDYYIPTMLFPFFLFYVSYYILIFIGPYFIGYNDKKKLHRYTTNLTLSSTIGFFIFMLFPTYVDRSSFQADKNSLFYKPLCLLQQIDTHGLALPSFHCLIAWLVFISIRQLKNIGIITKIVFSSLCLGICLSTFFIRQHGFIDFPAAVLLAEMTNACVTKWKLDIRLFDFIAAYKRKS